MHRSLKERINRSRRTWSGVLATLLATVAMATTAVAQTAGYGESVSLGLPQPHGANTVWFNDPEVVQTSSVTLGEPAVFSNDSQDGVIRHDVFQLKTNGQLPLPAAEGTPHDFDDFGSACPKPFTVDYLFLGPAGLSVPSSNVKMSELGVNYAFHIPILGEKFLFTGRPLFDVLFLSGPGGPPPAPVLPAQLYTLNMDMQLDYQFNEQWGLSVGITPGIWTDFVVISGRAFRIPTRILLTHKVSEKLFIAGGLLYTDNIYRNLLPGGGVIWMPDDRWRVEVVYPRARISYRVLDTWDVYALVERGGDTWGIRSFASENELFQYRDLRWFLGTEFELMQRFNVFMEFGMTFTRLMRFQLQQDVDVNSAFAFHMGTRF